MATVLNPAGRVQGRVVHQGVPHVQRWIRLEASCTQCVHLWNAAGRLAEHSVLKLGLRARGAGYFLE